MSDAEAAPAGAYGLNLAQAARFLGITQPTLREWIERYDVPVRQRGANGVPYQFDARDLAEWKRERDEADVAESERERVRVQQLQLELLGGETAGVTADGLTADERVKYLQSELAAMKLARERGQLVQADDVRETLERAFLGLRSELLAQPSRLARLLDLDRQQQHLVGQEARRTLERLRQAMAQIDAAVELEGAA